MATDQFTLFGDPWANPFVVVSTESALNVPERFHAVLRASGSRLVLFGAFNLRKSATNGGLDETDVFYASSQPGFFQGSAAGGDFRYYRYSWASGVRLKRSAQNILSGEPITSTVTISGNLTFPNHNKELDSLFGATGFQTEGETFEIGVRAIPSGYSGLRFGTQTIPSLSGLLGTRTIRDTEVEIPIGSFLDKLDDPLATSVVSTVEYPYAPEAAQGRTIPWLLGTCHGIEPILVDPTEQGGRYLLADHACDGGTFYRSGLPMTVGTEYIEDFSGMFGRAYIVLTTGLQGARITGDVRGVAPVHVGAFSDQLTDLNLHILASIGLNLNLFNKPLLEETRAAYPYAMGLPVLQETSARAIWDELNAGIPIILDQLRNGQYAMRPWSTPSGEPVAVLTDVHILSHEMSGLEKSGGTILNYAPNATILAGADVAGILAEENPDRAALLAKEFQTLTVRIPGAETHNVVNTYTTRIVSLADATALAILRNLLFGRPRIQHRVTVGSFGVSVAGLGDVVQLLRPRLRLKQLPGLTRVADIEEEWNSGGVEFTFLLVEEER